MYCSLFIFFCLLFMFYIRFKFALFSSLLFSSCFFIVLLPRPLHLSSLSPRFPCFLSLSIAIPVLLLSVSLFPLHYSLLAPISLSLPSLFLLFLHFEVARSHQSGFRFSVSIPSNKVSMPTTHVTLQVTDNLLFFPLPNPTSLYK